jgi:hypothetical protein
MSDRTATMDRQVARELERRHATRQVGASGGRRLREPGPLIDAEDLVTIDMEAAANAKGVDAKGVDATASSAKGLIAEAKLKPLAPAPMLVAVPAGTAAVHTDDCGTVRDVIRKVRSRQRRVDPKALTGRGARGRIDNAKATVDTIHQEMVSLSALSAKFGKGQLSLAVHRRDSPMAPPFEHTSRGRRRPNSSRSNPTKPPRRWRRLTPKPVS